MKYIVVHTLNVGRLVYEDTIKETDGIRWVLDAFALSHLIFFLKWLKNFVS